MRLELRSIKVLLRASEETHCYEARLYRDGKCIANVSNDGHGGADRVYPVGEMTYEGLREIDRHLAETLPPITGYGMEIPESLETWCAGQVERHLAAKEFARKTARAILFIDAAGRCLSAPVGAWTRDRIALAYPGSVVLNGHPDGLGLYLAATARRPQEAL